MRRRLYEVQRAMRARRETALRRGVVAVLEIGTSKVACLVLQARDNLLFIEHTT